MESTSPLFALRNVTKVFPGVRALDDVRLELYPGQVTALVGENGAGKSTLVKTMTGIYQPESGEIWYDGQQVTIRNPEDARQMGITAIHQETVLFDDMTVAENIFAGSYLTRGRFGNLDWKAMNRRAQEILHDIEAPLSPTAMLSGLSIGQKHMVAIARALSVDARVVILDEPTAALSHHEIHELYELVRRLKARGTAIMFITHKFDEIFAIADRYTVFRDGAFVGDGRIEDVTEPELVEMMVARSLNETYPKVEAPLGEEVFRAEGFSHPTEFADISFAVRKGEILGFYGLVGAGRTEIMRALIGLSEQARGEIYIEGQRVSVRSPADAVQAGLVYVPEERQQQGVMLDMPIYQNISLPQLHRTSRAGFLSTRNELAVARQYGERLNVKTSSWSELVNNLSGGNQQKVVIAKWLATHPRVIIMDEPTKGIDIGSKAAVHAFMSELVQQGLAVIMVSSELPEIMGMADRMIVMNEGRQVREFTRDEATAEAIVSAATGVRA
ncbi:sugar ABC transporter ATP-binding protein [Natronospirillum operosum]|uniref:Sugar ABC transporter ATP-binding protein n=1 Tax=Natronospirillum operosum TaxID=2759953 RepID=A0A4Z0WEA0_9GAMM|nr:sugar ABC transporter ATP-binding protein [Natronospirillum operosum]TGG93486.1 sugar ABC transporter ATP-binding protein [Natronospirillum operosum]